jgi:RNA polymerase sigma-70 factor (ECF subfamily)
MMLHDAHPGGSDERWLAERAAGGDQAAIIEIMRRHNQQLFRLAVGVLADRAEAEDILQESYLRAFARIAEYSGEGRLGAWLARIVRNEAIDRMRACSRRNQYISLEVDMRRADDEDLPLARARADETASRPDIDAERADVRRLIESEVAQLPDQFRAVFILREIEGLSVEETAEYLGIPDATVKSRDFRARALLKERLGEQIDASLPQAFTFLNQDCASLIQRVLSRLPKSA